MRRFSITNNAPPVRLRRNTRLRRYCALQSIAPTPRAWDTGDMPVAPVHEPSSSLAAFAQGLAAPYAASAALRRSACAASTSGASFTLAGALSATPAWRGITWTCR